MTEVQILKVVSKQEARNLNGYNYHSSFGLRAFRSIVDIARLRDAREQRVDYHARVLIDRDDFRTLDRNLWIQSCGCYGNSQCNYRDRDNSLESHISLE